jgi:hypothetical protein
MVTEQTYKDLICIKKVRNEFAHKIEAQSFSRPDIFQQCMNIKIAETHTHQMLKTQANIHQDEISMFVPNRAAMLADPRQRFVTAVVLLTKYFHLSLVTWLRFNAYPRSGFRVTHD